MLYAVDSRSFSINRVAVEVFMLTHIFVFRISTVWKVVIEFRFLISLVSACALGSGRS